MTETATHTEPNTATAAAIEAARMQEERTATGITAATAEGTSSAGDGTGYEPEIIEDAHRFRMSALTERAKGVWNKIVESDRFERAAKWTKEHIPSRHQTAAGAAGGIALIGAINRMMHFRQKRQEPKSRIRSVLRFGNK